MGVRWRGTLKNHLSLFGWWKYDEEGEIGNSLVKRERADQGGGGGIREGGSGTAVRCRTKRARVRDAETGWRGGASLVESGKASEATTHSSLRPREPCQPHILCVGSFNYSLRIRLCFLRTHSSLLVM